MPYRSEIQVADNELFLHFDTNNVIELRDLTTVLRSIADFAQSPRQLGPHAKITLRSVKSGSPTSVWIEVINTAGSIAGIAQLGLGLAMAIESKRENKVAKALALLLVNNDVVDFDFAFREGAGRMIKRITMQREEMPAVKRLRQPRVVTATGRAAGRGYAEAISQAVIPSDRVEVLEQEALARPDRQLNLVGRLGSEEGGGLIFTTLSGRSYRAKLSLGPQNVPRMDTHLFVRASVPQTGEGDIWIHEAYDIDQEGLPSAIDGEAIESSLPSRSNGQRRVRRHSTPDH